MSNGELHAYLDGALDTLQEGRARSIRAHLEECSECRRHLEQEASIRDQAQDLLGLAIPGDVAMPTLEELKEQAQAVAASSLEEPGTAPPQDSPRPFAHRLFDTVPPRIVLAWAASLVVALGIGWFGREARVGPWDQMLASTEQPASEATRGPQATDNEAAQSMDEVMEAGKGQSPEMADRLVTNAAAESQSEVRASREGLAQEGERDPRVDRSEAIPTAVTEVAGADQRQVEARDVAAALALEYEQVEPPEAPREELGAPAPQAAPPVALRYLASLPQGSELTVPGLAVLSVQTEAEAGEDIRIVQALPSGDPLELRYQRSLPAAAGVRTQEALADAMELRRQRAGQAEPERAQAVAEDVVGEADAALPGWNEVVVQLGDRQLSVRGPLSADSLRALIRPLMRGR